jgi:hypothetical protein
MGYEAVGGVVGIDGGVRRISEFRYMFECQI